MNKYEKNKFINRFIDEIDGKICDLMVDKYGNYTFQKFIEACNNHQILSIIKSMREKNAN